LDAIPGKHSIDSLRETAIFGTSHITQKALQSETWSLSGGDHHWFKRSTRKKRPVTTTNIKYEDLIIEIQCMWNVKASVIAILNRGDWNHLKITQTIPQQHTGRAW